MPTTRQKEANGPAVQNPRSDHGSTITCNPETTSESAKVPSYAWIFDRQTKIQMGEEYWSPGFVNYLFLAFSISTAFSPNDTPVLSAGRSL
jgi:hypothetical protein